MSTQAMSWAWTKADACESQGTHLTLLALAEFASPTGKCWPSRRTMARMCGFANKGSVTRHINKLVDLDLVRKDPRYQENAGRQKNNLYLLNLNDEEGFATATGEPESHQGAAPQLPGAGVPAATPRTTREEPTTEPTRGELKKDVERVAEHYREVFKPQRFKLGPARIRGIERVLQDFDVDALCDAIDGLHEFRKLKPGDSSLEAIWKTYKGTGSMVERVEFFISQAKHRTGVARSFPSADRAIVGEHQRTVQRGHRIGSPEAVQKAKDAEAWLREHGIETVREGDGGYPTFRPIRGGK